MSTRIRWTVLLTIAIAGVAVAQGRAAEAVVPGSFVDEFVVQMPANQFAMAGDWLPDGRLLVLSKAGEVDLVDPVAGTRTPVFSISGTSVINERGTLDLVIAPDFATSNQFFVYQIADQEPAHPRILRFTLDETDGAATAASQVVIWENTGPALALNFHMGGSLNIGNDNTLLLTIGDGGSAPQAQMLDRVWGKLIRLNLDGSIPTDNGFYDGAGPNLDEIHAIGLRNPFRGWFDPVEGELWVGDVGGNTAAEAYEELNRVTVGGDDFGWPQCEGPLGPPKNGAACGAGVTAPWYTYDHFTAAGCCTGRSIVAGEIYRGTAMPAEVIGGFIYGDWADDSIYVAQMMPDGSVGSASEIPTIASSKPLWVSVGPDENIYYLRFDWTTANYQLRRIRHIPNNDDPPIVNSVSWAPSPVDPLAIEFTADVSDPNGDPITYAWDFGDGATSSDPQPTHIYASIGSYDAQLVITANGVTVASDVFTVQLGAPPTVTITSPLDLSTFIAGDTLSLDATGNDPDGVLTASDYSWTVGFIHDTHQHPSLTNVVGNPVAFPIATTGHDYRGDTGYEITVVVTDIAGLTATDSVVIRPEKVDLTITNNLGAGVVNVDGIAKLAPFVIDTVVGFTHQLEAPDPLCTANTNSAFASWSDGESRVHEITVPASAETYTANYTPAGQCTPCPSTWEAELGTEAVAGFEVDNDPTASQGQYLWVPDGTLASNTAPPSGIVPVVEFCIDVAVADTYFLEGIVSSQTADGTSNSVWVQVDDGPWLEWHTPNSTTWTSQQAAPEFGSRHLWALSSGPHTVRLGHREDGTKIDSFAFVAHAPSNYVCNGLLVTVDMGAGQSPTNGPDVILGTPGNDVIGARGGDDVICALGGDDIITAGSGNDIVFGDAGNDILNGEAGDDELYGGSGADQIYGGSDLGGDLIRGGDGNDSLLGFGGNDQIFGDAGVDIIFGGTGDDEIHGGDGDDSNLSGGPGDDTLTGDSGNDLLFGNGGIDDIDGGSGDDIINTGSGGDVAAGGDGADLIYGVAGDDTLFGGDGDDGLYGGPGSETIDGGPGNDMIWGNEGNETITDPSGTNVLNGGPGDDSITGGADSDTIYGDGTFLQAGADVLDGGPGVDLLYGFAGDDQFMTVDGFVDTVNALGIDITAVPPPDTDNDSCTGDVADNIYYCENVTRE